MNISLPIQLVKDVEAQVKKGRFASVSEYIRQLIRNDTLYNELEEDRKQFEVGNYKVIKSLRDLR